MRDPKRIQKILKLLEAIWCTHPDLRFHQLISHLQNDYSNKNNSFGAVSQTNPNGITQTGFDFFHLEDDKFTNYLENYLQKLKSKEQE